MHYFVFHVMYNIRIFKSKEYILIFRLIAFISLFLFPINILFAFYFYSIYFFLLLFFLFFIFIFFNFYFYFLVFISYIFYIFLLSSFFLLLTSYFSYMKHNRQKLMA